MGGYNWLSLTDGGATYHPGLDLNSGSSCNADEGAAVVAMLQGVIRATLYWDGYSMGEGNHLWYEVDDPCSPGSTFVHHDHLSSIQVEVGQRVMPGDLLGTCGRTGGWDCAHLHTEWCNGPPDTGWWQWPKWWTRGSVEEAYWNPYTWWDMAKARVMAEGGDVASMQAMNDWELTNWVLATLYEWAGIPFNPGSGLAKTWVEALRNGVYAGRPRTAERPFGEGDGSGVWAEFDYRVLMYKADGTMSWNG